MSMSKEDGWENYYCYDCGKLLGHFYVGFGLERLLRWPLMKIMMLWETCSTCMVLNLMKLKRQVFMVSTPMAKNDFFDRLWREGKECSRK